MYFGVSYGKYTPVDIMLTHRLNQSSLTGMRHRGGFDIPLVIGFLPPRQRCRLWKPLPEVLCPLCIHSQQGALTPIGDVRAKGTAVPLDSQLVLKGVPTNGKWFVGIYFKTQKSPACSSEKCRGILWGFQMSHSCKTLSQHCAASNVIIQHDYFVMYTVNQEGDMSF